MDPQLDPLRRSRTLDPTLVFCESCQHSEFVHGDDNDRHCLYSVCSCEGFKAYAA